MITVYGAPPTRALRVLWMLEEMGLAYEVRRVDFATRADNPEFIAANPVGSFPAMQDGEVTMMESCAILEYLGAKYGPTPLTPGPDEASFPAYLMFLHFGEASLAGPMNIIMATQFFAPDEHKQNWGVTYAIDNFVRKSAALVQRLSEGPYLAGAEFTAADISCGYALGLARSVGAGDRLDPFLGDYLARLTKRPAYLRAAGSGSAPIPA
jgi:glutathione S-transferase